MHMRLDCLAVFMCEMIDLSHRKIKIDNKLMEMEGK